MANMKIEDVVQLLHGSVICYKGVHSLVTRCRSMDQIEIINIRDKSIRTVKFALEDFLPVKGRLGFANVFGGVVYLKRRPIRRWNVGLTTQNLEVCYVGGAESPRGVDDMAIHIKTLSVSELADCIDGIYPTFRRALLTARRDEGTVAFDRQFAIGHDGSVYYRTSLVGSANKDAKDVEDITFDPGYEHLILLLKGNYEKDCGSFAPSRN